MGKSKSWQRLIWQDPFLLEQQLSDEQRMVRDSTRQYAQQQLQPKVRDAFQKETSDPGIFRQMGEMGLLGLTIEGLAAPVWITLAMVWWLEKLNGSTPATAR